MPFEVVRKFEKTIAEYSGSKYGVAIDSCTNAIFLCCKYFQVKNVCLPKFTYPGVACSIIHAGGTIEWDERYWDGAYQLEPYPIYDSALRFYRGMYLKDSFWCLSFHYKKHLPIGRGGMILCNDEKAVEWFKRARFDGRKEIPLIEDNIEGLGWNCYMTPEQAARGLMLFEIIKNKDLEDLDWTGQGYTDLSKVGVYNDNKNS